MAYFDRFRFNGGADRQRQQRQQQILAQKLAREQLLVSRESFLTIVKSAINSVHSYGEGFLAEKSKGALEVLNSGVNVQVMFVKLGTAEKLKTGSDWDKETLDIGRGMVNQFVENVKAQKRQVEESEEKPSKRVKGFFKRMETYADALETALIDPSKVSNPRSMRYVGPSGNELHRNLVESGGKMRSGASCVIAANHEQEEMVKDVHANPDAYMRKYDKIPKKRAKAPSQVDHIPSSTFNFDLDESLLEGSDDPALDEDDDHFMAERTHQKPPRASGRASYQHWPIADTRRQKGPRTSGHDCSQHGPVTDVGKHPRPKSSGQARHPHRHRTGAGPAKQPRAHGPDCCQPRPQQSRTSQRGRQPKPNRFGRNLV